eukprot:TRINITY_DN24279_c0_g1_i1.p1 TRINITY_DN24279_c0_g1~~TRINITY_DN24279_c0_g1_i1.p1  ORF type:complete len:1187 (+),score=433.02 TRINITY_DN24279_c0_g1_i1:40-3561(+)
MTVHWMGRAVAALVLALVPGAGAAVRIAALWPRYSRLDDAATLAIRDYGATSWADLVPAPLDVGNTSSGDELRAATNALCRAIAHNGSVAGALGPRSSVEAIGVALLAGVHGIPVISVSATHDSLGCTQTSGCSSLYPTFRRTVAGDTYQGAAIAAFLRVHSWGRAVAVFEPPNLYSAGLMQSVDDAFRDANITLSHAIPVTPNDTASAVAELRSSAAQSSVIVVLTTPAVAATLVRECSESTHQMPCFGAGTAWIASDASVIDPVFVETVGRVGVGMLGVRPSVESERSPTPLAMQLTAALGRVAGADDMMAYDAMYALLHSLDTTGASTDAPSTRTCFGPELVSPWPRSAAVMAALDSFTYQGASGANFRVPGVPRYALSNLQCRGGNAEWLRLGTWASGGQVELDVYGSQTVWPGPTPDAQCRRESEPTQPESIPSLKGRPVRVLFLLDTREIPTCVLTKEDGSYLPHEQWTDCIDTPTAKANCDITRLRGFYPDLIAKLSQADELGFAYEANWQVGNFNGAIDRITGGMYDIGAIGFSITEARQRVVDFTQPVIQTGFILLTRNPSQADPGLWLFLKPFEWELWLMLLLFGPLVGCFTFYVEHDSPLQVAKHPEKRKVKVRVGNWSDLGVMMESVAMSHVARSVEHSVFRDAVRQITDDEVDDEREAEWCSGPEAEQPIKSKTVEERQVLDLTDRMGIAVKDSRDCTAITVMHVIGADQASSRSDGAQAGVEEGWVLQEVDGFPVSNVVEFATELDEALNDPSKVWCILTFQEAVRKVLPMDFKGVGTAMLWNAGGLLRTEYKLRQQTIAGRVLQAVIALITLVHVILYTSQLTAFQVWNRPRYLYDSHRDFLFAGKISLDRLVVQRSSSHETYARLATEGFSSTGPTALDSDALLPMLLSNESVYAAMWTEAYAGYAMTQVQCQVTVHGPGFNGHGLGFALPKGSAWTRLFSEAILRMGKLNRTLSGEKTPMTLLLEKAGLYDYSAVCGGVVTDTREPDKVTLRSQLGLFVLSIAVTLCTALSHGLWPGVSKRLRRVWANLRCRDPKKRRRGVDAIEKAYNRRRVTSLSSASEVLGASADPCAALTSPFAGERTDRASLRPRSPRYAQRRGSDGSRPAIMTPLSKPSSVCKRSGQRFDADDDAPSESAPPEQQISDLPVAFVDSKLSA